MALPWEKYETLSEAELNFLGFEWKPIWRVVVIDLIYFGSKEAKNYEVSGEFFFLKILLLQKFFWIVENTIAFEQRGVMETFYL